MRYFLITIVTTTWFTTDYLYSKAGYKYSNQFAKSIQTMTDKCKCSVLTKPSYLSRIVAQTKCPLPCSASSCSRATPSTRTYLGLCTGVRHSQPMCWCQAHQDWSILPCQPCQRQELLLIGSPPVQRVLVSFQGLGKDGKEKIKKVAICSQLIKKKSDRPSKFIFVLNRSLTIKKPAWDDLFLGKEWMQIYQVVVPCSVLFHSWIICNWCCMECSHLLHRMWETVLHLPVLNY